MAMMGSGRRGLQPDEIPPNFYLIMILVGVFCAVALLINFIRRSDNPDKPGVVDVYEQMVRARVKGRAPYIANYLDKKKKEAEEGPSSSEY